MNTTEIYEQSINAAGELLIATERTAYWSRRSRALGDLAETMKAYERVFNCKLNMEIKENAPIEVIS